MNVPLCCKLGDLIIESSASPSRCPRLHRHPYQRSTTSAHCFVTAEHLSLHNVDDSRRYRAGVRVAPHEKSCGLNFLSANTTYATGVNRVRVALSGQTFVRCDKIADSRVKSIRKPPTEFPDCACDEKNP